jgi:CRISPR system Cascade subunit CasE
MYLSRVELNQYLGATRRALAQPQVLHAALESSFPQQEADKRNLWRLDMLGHALYVLLFSRAKPDFTHIIEQFGWPAAEQTWTTKDYAPFLSRIEAGQCWRFRLAANPTHSVKAAAGARGKVFAHVTREQQKQWLLKRAQANGFALAENGFDVVQSTSKNFRRDGRTVTLGIAVFEGALAVSDAALLGAALTGGIGRAKAYGCGLLTLAKP